MQENWQKRLRSRQKSAILFSKACPAARFGVRADRLLAGTVPAVWKTRTKGESGMPNMHRLRCSVFIFPGVIIVPNSEGTAVHRGNASFFGSMQEVYKIHE